MVLCRKWPVRRQEEPCRLGLQAAGVRNRVCISIRWGQVCILGTGIKQLLWEGTPVAGVRHLTGVVDRIPT